MRARPEVRDTWGCIARRWDWLLPSPARLSSLMAAALAASPLRLLDDDTYRTMCWSLLPPMFIPSASFQGARRGYAFKLTNGRLGYHVDHVSSSLVAVALGRLSLTCRALLAQTAPHAATMLLRKSMVKLAVPTSFGDTAPSAADIANAEAALRGLRDSGVQYPGDIEEATEQLAEAREWRRKACDFLGQRFAAALAKCCVCFGPPLPALQTQHLYDRTPVCRSRASHGCACLSHTCVAWLISHKVLDELNLLKGGTNTHESTAEWEKQVQLHAADVAGSTENEIRQRAANVLRVFETLPSEALLMAYDGQVPYPHRHRYVAP